jgi:hypothetical protein
MVDSLFIPTVANSDTWFIASRKITAKVVAVKSFKVDAIAGFVNRFERVLGLVVRN